MLKRFLTLLISVSFCVVQISLFGQTADVSSEDKRDSDRDDMEALREWIKNKRLVTVKEIGGDLSLSAEVRTEFQATSEIKNGVQQRTQNTKPKYAWDNEVNLMFDYRSDLTWAAIKVEFDNDMGIRSGTLNKIRLEKGYFGGRVLQGDTYSLDLELGRRSLFNVFDSRIQFASLFDGGLVRFSKVTTGVGEFYANLASFIVNDLAKHYGFVTELGALRIGETPFSLKYSLIDWYVPNSEDVALTLLRFRFVISQLSASYDFSPYWFGKKQQLRLYAGVLTNHVALKNPLAKAGVHGQAFGRRNWAGYAGFSFGTARKKGDFAFNANYQVVEAQAIPEYDMLGIGRGNTAGVGLYTNSTDGSGGATTKATACGNTNFHGPEVEFLYLLTNAMTVQNIFKFSTRLDDNLGPSFTFTQWETEFIYAF
jgi:hypothetical protein